MNKNGLLGWGVGEGVWGRLSCGTGTGAGAEADEAMGPGADIGTRANPPTVKISTGIAGSAVSPLWRPSDYDTSDTETSTTGSSTSTATMWMKCGGWLVQRQWRLERFLVNRCLGAHVEKQLGLGKGIENNMPGFATINNGNWLVEDVQARLVYD